MHEILRRIRDIVSKRWFIRLFFFAIFCVSVVKLLLFERWARGEGPYVARPEAVAGLLPVGHFTSFFAWIRGGGWDTLLPAGPVIIIGALLVSFFLKRGFCGYICPVGTFWEFFAALGRKIFGRNFRMPRWLDYLGRGFQIFLTVAALFLLLSVSVSEAVGFRQLPYMWVADLKILHGFATPLFLALIALCGILSLLFGSVWCRYLCPVGGLYSLVSLLSPARVCRDEDRCTHCGKCARACHAHIAVDTVKTVRVNTCDGCLDCVHACPEKECLEAKFAGRVRIAPWVWPLLVAGIWFAVYFIALATGNWHAGLSAAQFKSAILSGILEAKTQGFF